MMMPISRRRRDTEQLISLIARCDPLGERVADGWAQTDEADALFRRIVSGAFAEREMAADVPGRRGRRPVILAVALLIVGAGVAGASGLLGGPAPPPVKADLANVDQGMPADLRYNPDVEDARLVARAGGLSLYHAALADGGYCSEIVTPSGPAGAICVPGGSMDREPIHVTAPFDDPVTISSPIVIGGRVNVTGVVSLQATFSGGAVQAVRLGDDGFFVFGVVTDHLADAHLHGVHLAALDAAGSEIASADVPPTDFSDPSKMDAKQPIFVSTISTGDDLTKVLGVEGSVNVNGAVALVLRYPDGSQVRIPLGAGGTYRYDLPASRRDDLFDVPGELIARDASGHELARVPVAAVAYWRSVR